MDSIPAAALVPVLTVWLGLVAYALWDLRGAQVRYLPKWGWAAAILLLTFGPIVYLVWGRDHR
jgi:hypothetical protein